MSILCSFGFALALGRMSQGAPVLKVVPPVASLYMSQTRADLALGAVFPLSVSWLPATAAAPKVSWVSSAPGIATVDVHGVMRGVAAGSAVISAVVGTGPKVAQCVVHVFAWKPVNPIIGTSSDQVQAAPGLPLQPGGSALTRVTAAPGSGIGSSVAFPGGAALWVRPTAGAVTLHLAGEDGTSVWFNRSLFQAPFQLANGQEATSMLMVAPFRSHNGQLWELFSASNSTEVSGAGAIYARTNGGTPFLFVDHPGLKSFPWPGVLDRASDSLWINFRNNAVGECGLFATDLSADGRTLSNDRAIISGLGKGENYQAYSVIRLTGGRIVLPVTYGKTSETATGPLYIDIWYSDDQGASWVRLGSPRTIEGRGLMEPQAVELPDGNVGLLCRTSIGYLARCTYYPKTGVLTPPQLTSISSPDAGARCIRLANGEYALAWQNSPNQSPDDYPRKVVALAFSPDLVAWHDYQVLLTSDALGDAMATTLPLVAQPQLFEDRGTLTAYLERVSTAAAVSIYKLVAPAVPNAGNPVLNADGLWHLMQLNGIGSAHVQLMVPLGPATFTVEGTLP